MVANNPKNELNLKDLLSIYKINKGNTAEIIKLETQRNEEAIDSQPLEQAKDYAIKAKGVINHNSLNRDDVNT